VRPDGYVGALVSSGQTTALESYMARVGLSGIHSGTSHQSLRHC
jgi:hypothetical protein